MHAHGRMYKILRHLITSAVSNRRLTPNAFKHIDITNDPTGSTSYNYD